MVLGDKQRRKDGTQRSSCPVTFLKNENHSREHSRYIAHCLNFRYMAYRNYYRGEGGISIAQRPQNTQPVVCTQYLC